MLRAESRPMTRRWTSTARTAFFLVKPYDMQAWDDAGTQGKGVNIPAASRGDIDLFKNEKAYAVEADEEG